MDFVRIEYTGRKPYRDSTPTRRQWLPGDVKLVPDRDMKALLRFIEFRRAAAIPSQEAEGQGKTGATSTDGAAESSPELDEALRAQAVVEEQEQATKRSTEALLLEVTQMDKAQLVEFAKQHFGADLDKRRSADTLRNEVTGLIQQHGAP